MTRVNCAGTLLRTTLALALLVGAAPRVQAAGQDPPNGAPLVDAGPDSSGVATSPTGATLVLFGQVSDPDNDILTVTWTGNFPTIQFEVYPPYFSGNAALYARLPIGVTEATLTVDDGNGHIVSDTVIVTVAGTNTAVGTAIDMILLDDRVAEYYGFTPGRLKLTFDSITAAGLTWMRTRTDQLPAPPAGKQLGSAPYYYDVESTSAGSGNVRICVDSTGMSFVSGQSVRLHRLNGTAWDDITLPSYAGGIRCALRVRRDTTLHNAPRSRCSRPRTSPCE